MTRRVPVKTALVGFLVAPAAMAQQPPNQPPPADPVTPPTENKLIYTGVPWIDGMVTQTNQKPQ